MSEAAPIPHITLYTRTGCKLCDQVKSALGLLASDYPHRLIEIDIAQDTSLLDQYRYQIPVVKIGTQLLRAPISMEVLRLALRREKAQSIIK